MNNMTSDPAFLFYPGDYLRDTQCLSPETQVAYDRIMCEHLRDNETYDNHMNNICISKSRINFFTKRLNDDQKSELMSVLTENDNGFYIKWVAESVIKRKAYSDSRRKNRSKSYDNHMNNICETYDEHMENENDNISKSSNSSPLGEENIFIEFWKLYPRKIGKGAAERAWKNKIKKPCETLELIKTALVWQKKSDQWKKENGQYIPHPATYINQRRWEDENGEINKRQNYDISIIKSKVVKKLGPDYNYPENDDYDEWILLHDQYCE